MKTDMRHSLSTFATNFMVEEMPIRRELCYYSPPNDGRTPRHETKDGELKGTRNYDHDRVYTDIHNARGHEEDFKLPVHGFTLHQGPDTKHIDFTSRENIDKEYLPLVEKAIALHIPHLIKIIPFDITTRHAGAEERHHRHVRKVHIDQSRHGAYLRAAHELANHPNLLDDVKKSRIRYRIVNAWRPINRAVTDHPLVFADSRTVADADLVPVEQVYTHCTGETLAVKYNSAQRFWYWKDMSTAETVLFQVFDSDGEFYEDGRMQSARCAHASFYLSLNGEPMTRESIEVRCIVLSAG